MQGFLRRLTLSESCQMRGGLSCPSDTQAISSGLSCPERYRIFVQVMNASTLAPRVAQPVPHLL